MPALKAADLDGLRAKIAALEKRPLLAEGAALTAARLGRGAAETGAEMPELFNAQPGLLQEIFADEPRDAGALLGFGLGLARGLLSPQRPALLYLQLAAEGQELGLPYALGLGRLGIDPGQVVIGRLQNLTELLWAIEEALACRAVAAVIADLCGQHKQLDFTVSRRLGLRSQAGGAATLLLRYGRQREASAAPLRWRVQPARSGRLRLDPQAPGRMRVMAVLEKGRLGTAVQKLEGSGFLLEWVDNGFVAIKRLGAAAGTGGNGVIGAAPLAGAQPAALGHRLSQAG